MRMKLSSIGERGLIRRLSSFLDIGDDAAYIRHEDAFLVLTTDMIYEKTHVLPGMDYRDIGRFIVNVNASDVASMGAKPLAFLLSCGLPDIEVKDFDALTHAVDLECRKYGMEYAGGDTKQSDVLTLAGFCIGTTKKPILRSGARAGDIVAVTGSLGSASLGTHMLLNGLDCKGFKGIVDKARKPKARVAEGLILGKYASAMTDISDSLSISLYNVAQASGVGVKVFAGKLPIDDAAKRLAEKYAIDVTACALYGGGDYELLFTMPKKDFIKVKDKVKATKIGVVTKKGASLFMGGKETRFVRKGFEHFSAK